MNVLVGPNNCGKSTVIGAFKILAAALRRARARKPDIVTGPKGRTYGYELSIDSVPISLENAHTDYEETEATITFRLSNKNRLQLYFPDVGRCLLIPLPEGKAVSTAALFKDAFPITVSVIPILGPVEHEEQLLQRESVQRQLETHRASRHFRNYWHHFPETFGDFSDMVARTWKGMSISLPELVAEKPPRLTMFCLEQRMSRELYWAGSGFQVWCQLLTHIVGGRDSTVLVVDEPEIYLHPDVQRQLVGILRELTCDVLTATHSPEIIAEADPSEIVLVDKKKRSGQRLRDVESVQTVLTEIGSSQNITLTRLARNRRVVFVEDESDFVLLRRFALKLGYTELAAGTEITAVSSGGFSSWERVQALGWGIGRTLGQELAIAAVYDRDYWCQEEVAEVQAKLEATVSLAHIHSRKEIENYLLLPAVLTRALAAAIEERRRRSTDNERIESAPVGVISQILDQISVPLRTKSQSQYLARRTDFLRNQRSKLDSATIAAETMEIFEASVMYDK